MNDWQNIVHGLRERSVTLCAIEQPVDAGTVASKAFPAMLCDSDEPEQLLLCSSICLIGTDFNNVGPFHVRATGGCVTACHAESVP